VSRPFRLPSPSCVSGILPLQYLLPRLSLVCAMIIVGSSVVTGAYVTSRLPVEATLWLRFVAASCVMLPLLFWREGGLPRLPLRDWAILFAQAGCGGFLFNTLLLEGLRYTDPASAGIITATGPACALVVSAFLLREPLTRSGMVAVGLAVAGIALLHADPVAVAADLHDAPAAHAATSDLFGPAVGAVLRPVWGTMLVVGAVMAESLFLLLGKCLQRPVSALTASTLLCVFGAVQFAPQGALQLLSGGMHGVDGVGWGIIAWYALGITVGAYLLWFTGVARVRGSEAGVYTGVMPVSAMLFATVCMGTPLHWQHWAGCAAVLLGIVAAAKSGSGGA